MLFLYFLLLNVVLSAPVKIVTRVHTAEAVTTTQTYTTGTTTVWLPPVELFISNGVTYTFTQTDSPAGVPTTYTSVYSSPEVKAVEPTTTAEPETTTSTTPATTQQTTPTTTQQTTPTTTSTTPTTTQQTTQQTTPATTQETTPATTQETTPATTQETTQQNTPTTTSSTSTTSTTSESTATSSGTLDAPWGIVYSPYADDGSCKTSSTVESDLKYISGKGIQHIRTYGTDCESLKSVLSVSLELGIKVNQGLWMDDTGPDSLDGPVSALVDYISANGDDVFDFITIANEAIVSGYCTVSELLSKVSSVKKQLQNAGYSGKVTTAEPPVSYTSNSQLCDSDSPIDFVSINPHSYFNADIDASQAGEFVANQLSLVESSCPKLSVKITETGYPSQGDTNGLNVPSKSNQEIALKSILAKTGDITILTTYNDFWKQPGQYGIEQYFGAAYLFK
ncbi:cell wall protein [Yamadazyma tenuis]|uniref:cell wall protein n=1 Tax=Candida tenuis TaxID=2315449 RepID=UPI0027A37D7E|nr:cell wall protein [Yamadazyma tenuis]